MPTRRITGLKEGPSASNGSAIGHYQRHRAQPHRILLGSTVLEMREKVGKPAMAPSPAVQSSSVSCGMNEEGTDAALQRLGHSLPSDCPRSHNVPVCSSRSTVAFLSRSRTISPTYTFIPSLPEPPGPAKVGVRPIKSCEISSIYRSVSRPSCV
ncbi:hypothetical protein Bbelb_426530 [Branchiostoma belcheri]|nr:hypothetical protein Bbelb_426530 [Branchiostoma belcheri]